MIEEKIGRNFFFDTVVTRAGREKIEGTNKIRGWCPLRSQRRVVFRVRKVSVFRFRISVFRLRRIMLSSSASSQSFSTQSREPFYFKGTILLTITNNEEHDASETQ